MYENKIFDTLQINQNNYYANIYKEKYISTRTEYVKAIDILSKKNSSLEWWVNTPAFKFIQNDNIYNAIILIEALKKFKDDNKVPEIIYVKNNLIKKIIEKNKGNLKINGIKIISQRKYFYKLKIFISSTKTLLNFLLLKFLSSFQKKNINKKLFLIDSYFMLNRSDNDRYYGKYVKNLVYKNNNFQFIPTFISKNIFDIKEIRNFFKVARDDNYLIKEKFISFFQILKIFILLHTCYKKLNEKVFIFNNIDYSEILKFEIKNNKNFELSFIGCMNYFFFKNLKFKKFSVIKSINWFENQPSSKGWFYGLSRYFPRSTSIGYQGFTYYPEMLSIFPTNQEFLSRVVPKQITLIGNVYKNLINEFTNNIVLKIGEATRFEYLNNLNSKNFNEKKIDYVLILSGIKDLDLEIINLSSRFLKNNKKIYIKAHPIFNPVSYLKNLNNFVLTDKNFSYLLENSKCLICSGSTSALIEAIALGINLIIPKVTYFEDIFIHKIKLYKNQKVLNSDDFNIFIKSKFFIKKSFKLKKITNSEFFNLSQSGNIDKVFRI